MIEMKQALNNFSKIVSYNSPTILTAIAVGGVLATVFFTAKQTPKIQKTIEEKKEELQCVREGDTATRNAIVAETVKEVAIEALPIVIFSGLTIGCCIKSNQINQNRNAAIMASYIAADQALKDRKEAEKRALEKKELESVDEQERKLKEDRVAEANGGWDEVKKRRPPLPNQQIVWDLKSNQIFYANPEKIKKVELEINDSLEKGYDEFIPWNHFLTDIGEQPRQSRDGQSLGFNIKHGLRVDYDSMWDDDESVAFCTIDYDTRPPYSYG